jgi:hypothetical protein
VNVSEIVIKYFEEDRPRLTEVVLPFPLLDDDPVPRVHILDARPIGDDIRYQFVLIWGEEQ